MEEFKHTTRKSIWNRINKKSSIIVFLTMVALSVLFFPQWRDGGVYDGSWVATHRVLTMGLISSQEEKSTLVNERTAPFLCIFRYEIGSGTDGGPIDNMRRAYMLQDMGSKPAVVFWLLFEIPLILLITYLISRKKAEN